MAAVENSSFGTRKSWFVQRLFLDHRIIDQFTVQYSPHISIVNMTDHSSGISFERFKTSKESQENRFCNDFVQAGKDLLDVTFEGDLFEFSVEDSQDEGSLILPERKSSWFPDFSMLQEQADLAPEPMQVQVSLHEQLSATYDEFSQEGSISVSGTVHVKSTNATSFNLIFNDDAKCIQRIEPVESICRPTSTSSQEVQIELHPLHENEEVLVATYMCDSKLRPIPLVCQCILCFSFLISESSMVLRVQLRCVIYVTLLSESFWYFLIVF
jgi:hypothetical protein